MPVPMALRDRLVVQQADRLRAYTPLLCLVIGANALAMATAVWGDLPLWQQVTPPLLIVVTCLLVLYRTAGKQVTSPAGARRRLNIAAVTAGALGLVAGAWSVNAFVETERYYCMVAPVFIGIAALVSATCLHSAPRAAIIGMTTTVLPVIIKMMSFDNMGVRATGAMMLIVTLMQASVVIAKFRETVGIMILQNDLQRLAETDALTGLDNRHAFMGKLRSKLDGGTRLTLILADLDGFKSANDRYGHLAGDAVLVGVAGRLRELVPQAVSIARLGGDEFALLFDNLGVAQDVLVESLRAAVALPLVHDDQIISVGASFGVATTAVDCDDTAMIHAADMRLYADKADRGRRRLESGSNEVALAR